MLDPASARPPARVVRLDAQLAVLVLVALLGLLSTSCVYARIIWFNTPSMAAPTYFDNRVVRASTEPVPLPKSESEVPFALTTSEHATYASFDELLEANHTRAFLVVHDD